MESEFSPKYSDFPTMFRSEYAGVVRAIAWILDDQGLAREVCQEAFIRLFVKWNRVSRYEYPGAWVRKTAIRLAIKLKERRKREVFEEPPDSYHHSPTENTAMVLDIRSAIEKLPRKQKAAVLLHYFYDLPIAEVAEQIGCKESTAKVHLHSARENLRSVLADQGYGIN